MPLMIAVEYSAKESNACPWEDSDAHTPHHSAAIPQKDSSHLVGAEIWLHLRRLRSLAAVRFATPRRLHPQGCPDRSPGHRWHAGKQRVPAASLSATSSQTGRPLPALRLAPSRPARSLPGFKTHLRPELRTAGRRRQRRDFHCRPHRRKTITMVSASLHNSLVRNGSEPVKLRLSKCFPICSRKQSSDLRIYEYTPY